MRRAQGLYIISVASQILEMHPQTLRKYERAGFVEPPRMGVLRLYSEEDIARLRLIKYLVEDLGLNLAGVEMVLALVSKVLRERSELLAREGDKIAKADAVEALDGLLGELGLKVSEGEAARSRGRGALPDRGAEGPEAIDFMRLTWTQERRQGHPSR